MVVPEVMSVAVLRSRVLVDRVLVCPESLSLALVLHAMRDVSRRRSPPPSYRHVIVL